MYRDPVRSSHGHFVKAKGLCWVSLMLLTDISWASRVWALVAHTISVTGNPEEVLCPVCGRSHTRAELHVLVPEMRRAISRQIIRGILRSRPRHLYRIEEAAYGFLVKPEVQQD